LSLSSHTDSNGDPWTVAHKTALDLYKKGNGYLLSDDALHTLQKRNVWAILIDNNTHSVIWKTDNLPSEIPMKYSLSDIAALSRGYVKDYPTFTSKYSGGLVVLGFPKTSYWKLMYNSWDYDLIANSPKIVLTIILSNIFLIFLIYMIANTKLLKSVDPILKGIEALPEEKDVYVKEKGILSEIAVYINRTSSMLEKKNYELKRREKARENWIAGVSHDIRTPLSMVMGYAGQLEDEADLPEDARQKAAVIRNQSVRMKNLINDLNLVSKLEYNMQPLNSKKMNVVSAVRQVVVDFINSDIQNNFPIEWLTPDELKNCFINGDDTLIKRAITNLIQNSINHNEDGCTIFVSVSQSDNQCLIKVDDSGIGADDESIEKIKNTPHYMICDANTTQRHGLGLLIVKQIVSTHHGQVSISHSSYGGFSVTLSLPVEEE
jgi:signal transduction histidine kinase